MRQDNADCGWQSVDDSLYSAIPTSTIEEINSSTADDAGDKKTLLDITEFLHLPQAVVSVHLGMPTSPLSKKWENAAKGRKWPHRIVARLDAKILHLMESVPQDKVDFGKLPHETEAQLTVLLMQRAETLKQCCIRL